MNKAPTTPLRVALYVRISTDEQVEKYGIDLQKDSLMALIKSKPKLENGDAAMIWAGDKHTYIDSGISGTIPLDERSAFAKLKEDIIYAPEGEKPFDVVAVYKIDRFARQLRILLDVIDFFEEKDIQFLSANESIDTSTPFGKAILGIIGIIAELERDTILKRTNDGCIQAFEAGVVMGRNAPYGYKKDEYKKYKILEEEAEVVKGIFHMFVNRGMSIDAIAKYLTQHLVLSPEASAFKHKKRKGEMRKKEAQHFWRGDRIRYFLSQEIYIGKIFMNRIKGKKVIPRDEWILSPTAAPSIIDMVTFDKAQRTLNQSKHSRKVAKDNHVYLLSGLLKCDCCYDEKRDKQEGRSGWHGERKLLKGNHTHYYQCGRKNRSKTMTPCSAIPLPANAIELYVFDFIKDLIKSPQAVFNHQQQLKSNQNTIKHLRKKEQDILNLMDAIPHRKERLREQHEVKVIDTPYLKEAIDNLDKDRARHQEELNNIQRELAHTTLSRGYIESLEIFSEKYKDVLEENIKSRPFIFTVMHELIEEIVVYSRPVNEKDGIAGRKKGAQQMPYRLHIKLKLPQDIINKFGEQQVYIDEEAKILEESSGQKSGSGGRYRTRTYDLPGVNGLLYQLS
jgi:site-specific DNA recombinase